MSPVQTPGLNIITEYMIGYLYPGRPVANVSFKTYGYISMTQAVSFLSDFKLGHYMKIPPISMFVVQVCSVVHCIANLACTQTMLGVLRGWCHSCKECELGLFLALSLPLEK